MYIASQMAGTTINAVMIFQYMNIVLIVMQKYHHMKHLLSEAESTAEFDTSNYGFVEDITSNSSNKMFSPAKDDLKITENLIVCVESRIYKYYIMKSTTWYMPTTRAMKFLSFLVQ